MKKNLLNILGIGLAGAMALNACASAPVNPQVDYLQKQQKKAQTQIAQNETSDDYESDYELPLTFGKKSSSTEEKKVDEEDEEPYFKTERYTIVDLQYERDKRIKKAMPAAYDLMKSMTLSTIYECTNVLKQKDQLGWIEDLELKDLRDLKAGCLRALRTKAALITIIRYSLEKERAKGKSQKQSPLQPTFEDYGKI